MVKLIHTSDLHLDSRLSTLADSEKACIRRNELTEGFFELAAWAHKNGVDGILVCGDLFETGQVSPRVKRDLIAVFKKYPQITFFLLSGNHDADAFDSDFAQSLPQNVKTFGKDGSIYYLGGTAVYGREADRNFSATELPLFDAGLINIVMLHGSWDPAENDVYINLKKCVGHAIDYMALGHFHDYAERQIDARGTACYCGCLQARGFDECGQKGFILLEIDGCRLKRSFVPFGKRQFFVRKADVSGCASYFEILERVNAAVKDIPPESGVKMELAGEVSESLPVEPEKLQRYLKERFFTARVSDKTRIIFDTKAVSDEISLKNEFKRIINGMNVNDAKKQDILRLGLAALSGEDLL